VLKGIWSGFAVDLKAKPIKLNMLFHRLRFLFEYFTPIYVTLIMYISDF